MIIFELIEPSSFAIAILGIFTAYFIFGVTGFGSSLVAVPILVQLYPLQVVVPMMVLIDLCASLYLGRKSSDDADKKELLWIFPFTLIGMFLGVTLLLLAPSYLLLSVLGLFAAANGMRVLSLKSTHVHAQINKWWALPFGIAGGVFTALFATGGAIYASYLQMRISDPKLIRATMAFAIFMLTLLRLVFMLATGLLLSMKVLGLVLALILPMALGLFAGSHWHSKMSKLTMQRVYGATLLVSGMALLLRQLL